MNKCERIELLKLCENLILLKNSIQALIDESQKDFVNCEQFESAVYYCDKYYTEVINKVMHDIERYDDKIREDLDIVKK